MSSGRPLPNVCSDLPLENAMAQLLDRCASGARTDAWLVFEGEPPAALHGFWADDPLDTAMGQAVLEEQAAERLISEPLRRACGVVYAARGPLMADLAHPWPDGASCGSLVAVVISALEASPIVITQEVTVGGAGAAVEARTWQRPGLAHLPADLPGLLIFRAVQTSHPVVRMSQSIFGEPAERGVDEGTWNR